MAVKNLPAVRVAQEVPILADVLCPQGTVKVAVNPQTDQIQAKVWTRDETGPAAQAVSEAEVRLDGQRLLVQVPELQGGNVQVNHFGGGSYVSGMTISGGVTIINGRVMVNGQEIKPGPPVSRIEVEIILPPMSGVKLQGQTVDLSIDGALMALAAEAHNCSVSAATLGRCRIDTHNGGLSVTSVTETLDMQSHNGNAWVGSYGGGAARVVTHNGSIDIIANSNATGHIYAKTHNGDAIVRGVRGRSDLTADAKSYNGRGQVL